MLQLIKVMEQLCGLSLKNQKSQNSVILVWFSLINAIYKMETQKNLNLSNEAWKEYSKFAARNWSVINDQNRTNYVAFKSCAHL